MTEVVNIKTDKYDVYIGRGSTFGNPYKIGEDGTREDVIEKYKSWFDYKVKNMPDFKEAVLGLKNKKIACFCAPLYCHGNIIKEYLDSQDITNE